jgi:hypothetical protein
LQFALFSGQFQAKVNLASSFWTWRGIGRNCLGANAHVKCREHCSPLGQFLSITLRSAWEEWESHWISVLFHWLSPTRPSTYLLTQ